MIESLSIAVHAFVFFVVLVCVSVVNFNPGLKKIFFFYFGFQRLIYFNFFKGSVMGAIVTIEDMPCTFVIVFVYPK